MGTNKDLKFAFAVNGLPTDTFDVLEFLAIINGSTFSITQKNNSSTPSNATDDYCFNVQP